MKVKTLNKKSVLKETKDMKKQNTNNNVETLNIHFKTIVEFNS